MEYEKKFYSLKNVEQLKNLVLCMKQEAEKTEEKHIQKHIDGISGEWLSYYLLLKDIDTLIEKYSG